MSDFFGLTQEYKIDLHKTLFNMVTFGKGGWDWESVYNLPVYLRQYYTRQMADTLEAERKAHENISKPKMPTHRGK